MLAQDGLLLLQYDLRSSEFPPPNGGFQKLGVCMVSPEYRFYFLGGIWKPPPHFWNYQIAQSTQRSAAVWATEELRVYFNQEYVRFVSQPAYVRRRQLFLLRFCFVWPLLSTAHINTRRPWCRGWPSLHHPRQTLLRITLSPGISYAEPTLSLDQPCSALSSACELYMREGRPHIKFVRALQQEVAPPAFSGLSPYLDAHLT